jgi:hypothetical protein
MACACGSPATFCCPDSQHLGPLISLCASCGSQGLGTCRDCTFRQVAEWSPMVPESEVAYLKRALPQNFLDTEPLAEFNARCQILYNRIVNSICNTCGRKPLCTRPGAAILCPDCHFYWWCSEGCRQMDRGHSQVCGRADAPRDMGPLRTIVFNSILGVVIP